MRYSPSYPHDTNKNGGSLTADDPQDGIEKKQQNISRKIHHSHDHVLGEVIVSLSVNSQTSGK